MSRRSNQAGGDPPVMVAKSAAAAAPVAGSDERLVEDLFGYPVQDAVASDYCSLWTAPLVGTLHFRRFRLPARYFAPNKRGLCRIPDLYVCDCCGCDFEREEHYLVHEALCDAPLVGTEVYRDIERGFIVTEARGDNPACAPACSRFSLLAKHFLDHKVTFLDLEGFVYYLLFEIEPAGIPEQQPMRTRHRAETQSSRTKRTGRDRLHFAGYFSRDADRTAPENLACIAVLPPYQSRGYGAFLIHLSYELTRRAGAWGSPERPLTRAGRRAYTAVWKRLVLLELERCRETHEAVSIRDIARRTGMFPSDVLATLATLELLRQTASVKSPSFTIVAGGVGDVPVPRLRFEPDKLHA